jgi:cbb3-type cytochrome c oxidase subunit III
MGRSQKLRQLVLPACLLLTAALVALWVGSRELIAGPFKGCWAGHGSCVPPGGPTYVEEWGGNWYWMRSPEEEKRFVAGLYNRYCIRCHGVDGRGVWDIPDVPDFTNARWQSHRTDGQLTRNILEGRGAVMPPFRGTLSLDEAWAMSRYLRTFIPGTEVSRPEYGPAEKAPTAK